ncbi:MAG: uroporphyrinogen-III synthase [Luteimonas sp.]
MSDVLAGCYVISLRPAGQHAAMRRAAHGFGARVLALSPWRLRMRDDAAARAQLGAALDCECVLFTSPAAVRAAAALQPLRARGGQDWCAVGSATARAVQRAGVAHVVAPSRMDSEGVLSLAALGDPARRVGLVTAPGGRDLVETLLAARGTPLVRADVYAREPIALSPRAVARLVALHAPRWLALSSGAALERALSQLPASARARLLESRVVASSDRLARLARAQGFAAITLAGGPRPRDLLAAAAADASASMPGDSFPERPSAP